MGASPTVLIVEDDADLRQLLVHTFEGAGFDTVAVSDGGEALSYLESADEPPALVILDLLMPEVDGLDFLAKRPDDDVPVIVLTGVDDEETLAEAYERGANDYVTKPFSPKELLTRAKHLQPA